MTTNYRFVTMLAAVITAIVLVVTMFATVVGMIAPIAAASAILATNCRRHSRTVRATVGRSVRIDISRFTLHVPGLEVKRR